MIIRKFLHSCILLEDNGKKLLIDPGKFSFIENKVTVDDIGPVDAILITHSHWDHYFPEALKELLSLKRAKIFTNKEIVELLQKEGINAEEVEDGQEVEAAGFNVKALKADHGTLPIPVPKNTAFLINNKFLHPGDSYDVKGIESCEVLFLPISAPWSTANEAMQFAEKLKPKMVIPIHEAFIKDFMIDRLYFMAETHFSKTSIKFKPLKLGEQITV